MKPARSIKTHIIIAFVALIASLGIIKTAMNHFIVRYYVLDRAKKQLQSDLRMAQFVFDQELFRIRSVVSLAKAGDDLGEFRGREGLDYLVLVREGDSTKSRIVKKAEQTRRESLGTRIIGEEELKSLGQSLCERSEMEIIDTPQSRPSKEKVLKRAMALEYARPFFDWNGNYIGILAGGEILNRNFTLVDRIHDTVFEDRRADQKTTDIVTIFIDDVRVATNVLDDSGKRAVGTRAPSRAYEKVIRQGAMCLDRAFVVTDRYLTAYEPIKNIDGEIIGMLYVGTMEKPFRKMEWNIFLSLSAGLLVVIIIALIIAFLLVETIAGPILKVLGGIEDLSHGSLDCRVEEKTAVKELDALASSFNSMATAIQEREKSLITANEKLEKTSLKLEITDEKLQNANEKLETATSKLEDAKSRLEALNSSYLGLMSFLSRELKGIISSMMMNTSSVRDGIIGVIDSRQRIALDAVAGELDYLNATVNNFLSLSRLEKDEAVLSKRAVLLNEEIFHGALEVIAKAAAEKNIKIINNLGKNIKVLADPDLLLVMANNLAGNALNYCPPGGRIILSGRAEGSFATIELYNDSRSLTGEEKEKLFRKFSRLSADETGGVRGAGLGLFIAREIIEKHGGRIWAEAREKGNAFIFRMEREISGDETAEHNQVKESETVE
ncbi:MAG: cache domain-containing protein [Candidatus Eremiobacteraeota bacterium]|nr:cache domain-containing protein [Candidatus Eremiobacteraeota bacterium]